jgi:hypothetical protein
MNKSAENNAFSLPLEVLLFDLRTALEVASAGQMVKQPPQQGFLQNSCIFFHRFFVSIGMKRNEGVTAHDDESSAPRD